jgi:hypothetical protein
MEQFGVLVSLSRKRSRVQVPLGPLSVLSRAYGVMDSIPAYEADDMGSSPVKRA